MFSGKEFLFPNFSNQRVLIVGVGGGSDIISAYALAKVFVEPCQPRLMIYANTKRRADKGLEFIAPHVYRVEGSHPKRIRQRNLHGSTIIDQSVPRGNEGCPWIFCLPRHEPSEKALLTSLKNICTFDWIISVDTGADSMVESPISGSYGRDKQMLRLLRQMEGQKLHICIAPGCDGETTAEDFQRVLLEWDKAGKYLGSFPVDPFLPIYEDMGAPLSPARAPNIIVHAFKGLLSAGTEGISIPRGRRPVIPARWLFRAFVFLI